MDRFKMCIFQHRNYNFKTMKYIFYVLVLCIMASCQYFETDKISSDTFYDQEIKTISWNQVDQYPTFVSCQKDSEKKERKLVLKTHWSLKYMQGSPPGIL